MENEDNKSMFNEPDLNYGNYTYADYLTWDLEELVELIKGKVFKKVPRHKYGIRKDGQKDRNPPCYHKVGLKIIRFIILHVMRLSLNTNRYALAN
jgi:hypothetical protein